MILRHGRPLGLLLLAVALAAPTGLAGAAVAAKAGSAKFATPSSASSGGTLPKQTAVGDFDGDGNLDGVSVNQGPSGVFGDGIGIALGDGAGHLGRTVTADVGDGYGGCDVAVGDWNSDGKDDLVVLGCTTGGPGNVVAFVSTAGGHLQRTQSWAGYDLQLAAGDVDNDGHDDFVTSAKGSPQVRTYLGKGDGTFGTALKVVPSFDSYDAELGDVDDDGDLDLVGAAGGPVWTMLGNGNGTFGSQVFRFSEVLTGIELALADFDGDGLLDVAVVDASDGHVNTGLGTGSGAFADGQRIPLGTRQALWVTAGNVTPGGAVDLVAGLDNDSTVSALLPGDGAGGFAPATHWVVGTAGLGTGDFDDDARDDLLSFTAGGRMYLSLARGKGFRAARLTPGPLAGDLRDVNGDGLLDKLSGTTGLRGGGLASQVIVQLGRGDGTFGKPIVSHVRAESAASGIGDIDVADINEDGILDVVGGFDNFEVTPYNLFWMVGKGDGSFRAPTLSSVGDVHADVNAIAASDVDGDGHVDLVANDLAQLVVRRGNGKGAFGAPLASGVGSGADRAVLVDDFTGDGIKDVVTTVRTGSEDFGSGEIRLQKGSGDGTFTLAQIRGVDSNLAGGRKADLNGDGRPDVVTAGTRGSNGGRNALWVLLTTANGALGEATPYLGPFGAVDTADVDRDGDIDIATSGAETVDFYLNDATGTFPDVDRILAAGSLGVLGDLTGDGAPEVLSGSPFGEFAVHLNTH